MVNKENKSAGKAKSQGYRRIVSNADFDFFLHSIVLNIGGIYDKVRKRISGIITPDADTKI